VIPDPVPVRAFLADRHVALAERLAALAARDLAPLPAPADDAAARVAARDLLARLGADGWLDPIGAQDWRGCCITREALGAVSPLADAVFALQGLGTGAANVDADEGRIRVPVGTDGAAALRESTRRLDERKIELAGFAVHRPTLDDVFLSLTGHGAEEGEAPASNGKRKRGRKKASA